MSTLLIDLQEGITTLLAADALFIGPPAIPLLTEKIGDLENIIQQNLNSLGISVLVGTPLMKAGEHRNQIEVTVIVIVEENVIMNTASYGTGKSAQEIMIGALAVLRDAVVRTYWGPLKFESLELNQRVPTTIYHMMMTTHTDLITGS